MSESELVRSILERLGRVELMLFGSGDSISWLLQQNRAQIETLRSLPDGIEALEETLRSLDGRLAAVEVRVHRQRENLKLRELIGVVNSVPGGWQTFLVILVSLIAAIDVAIDYFGVASLLRAFFRF